MPVWHTGWASAVFALQLQCSDSDLSPTCLPLLLCFRWQEKKYIRKLETFQAKFGKPLSNIFFCG